MAVNEYFHRTPTSTGNRHSWTLSFWVKRNAVAANQNPENTSGAFFNFYTTQSSSPYQSVANFNGDGTIQLGRNQSATDHQLNTSNVFRDVGNWMHILVKWDVTKGLAQERLKLYVNGVLQDSLSGNHPSQRYDGAVNTKVMHTIGTVIAGGVPYAASGPSQEYFDYFLVDGQALDADVFGFYKDGDGYVSVGSTQATDFRPGQWSPHSPRKIKTEIERRGGFGVNGFYLPMNDSSNPGADFHCDPNSIITLKGEDLPQPRNGAPTTTDAYVSQLRQEVGTLGFDGVVKFDGTDDYISIGDSSDWDIGTAAFTLEGWVLIHSNSVSYSGIFGMHTGSTQFQFRINNVGRIQFLQDFGGTRGNVDDNDTSGHDLRDNKFHHVAMVRKSDNSWQLYVDGYLNYSGTGMTGNITGINEVALGRRVDTNSYYLNGFISNFRFVSGTAVYTSNFTPPTEPLTAITNTKLLCCNSSTSATASTVTPATITANGGAFATRNELTGSMVLAVPGISTATSANLVSNGHFDTNTTGWTAGNSATLSVDSGRLKVTNGTSSAGYAYQAITVEVGKRYTVNLEGITGTSASNIRIGTAANSASYGNKIGSGLANISLTATSTSLYVTLKPNSNTNGNNAFFDNIVVKQEDAPRDYSADIKGSGTNKTLTANGATGVGYELGGYYGSAMTFDGTTDYFTIPDSEDFNMGAGDFTLECWVNSIDDSDYQGIFGSYSYTNDQVLLQIANNGNLRFVNPNQQSSQGSSDLQTGQWNHIVMERYNGRLYGYVNGVAEINTAYTNSIDWGHNNNSIVIGIVDRTTYPGQYEYKGSIQDLRLYKGVAKYKGGFDVPKPYTPVGIESWRTVSDTCKNNFAIFNPVLGIGRQDQLTYSEGNLKVVSGATGGSDTTAVSTMAIKGKIYCEFSLSDDGVGAYVGIMKYNTALTNNGVDTTASSDCWLIRGDNEHKANGDGGGGASYGTGTWSTGDIIMMAVDIDNTSIWWGKNGTWYASGNPGANSNAAYTNLPSTEDLLVMCGDNYSSETPTIIANFGQNPSFSGTVTAGTNADDSGKGLFKYAPPTGFLALCEDNLPTPAIADPGEYFKTVLYEGDGSAGRSITGVGFQPDLVWLKSRTNTASHRLSDSVRGAGKQLMSNTTEIEATFTTMLTSFDSDGFTLGDNAGINGSGYTNLAWCWKAGGPAVTNNDGQLTTQVSANQTAGFSIVTWLSNAVGSIQTLGHGLGKSPDFIIVKNRDYVYDWFVWHKDLANTTRGYLRLNLTNGETTGGNDTWSVSSTTFGLRQSSMANANTDDFVAYCWAEIEGYSKFGKYIASGNADGPFVYCGFKPAWVLIKPSTFSSNWIIMDSSRGPVNPDLGWLYPDGNYTEDKGSSRYCDFLSNGFKIRNGGTGLNSTNNTYLFAAFAESPFQTANAK